MLLGFKERFESAALVKEPVGIVEADHLVALQQIYMIHLQALQRRLDLAHGRIAGAPVDLGHDEGAVPVAVFERLAEPDLALAAIIVPRVVAEVDAGIDSGAHKAHGLIGRSSARFGKVEAADADDGQLRARFTEHAIFHAAFVHGFGRRAEEAALPFLASYRVLLTVTLCGSLRRHSCHCRC